METNPADVPVPANISNKFGVLCLFLPLVGLAIFLLSSFIWIPGHIVLVFVAYILGIVFYFKQKKVQATKIATAGMIIAIIGVILAIYGLLVVFNPVYDPVTCRWEMGCRFSRQGTEADKIIMNARTKSDCDEIKGKAMPLRDYCYSHLVDISGNPDDCERIQFVPEKDRCYYNNVNRLVDPGLCDKITNFELLRANISQCYERAYRAMYERVRFDTTNNLCMDISEESKKQACLYVHNMLASIVHCPEGSVVLEDRTCGECSMPAECREKYGQACYKGDICYGTTSKWDFK